MPFVICPKCSKESMAPRELMGLQWYCPACQAPILVEDDQPIPRRRRRRRSKSYLWIGLALVGMIAAAVVVTQIAGRGGIGGSSWGSGSWTNRELAAHLAERGFRCELDGAGGDTLLIESAQIDAEYNALYWRTMWKEGFRPEGVVAVRKYKSAEEARQAAESVASGTLAWGVYCFWGAPKTLQKLEAALR